MAAEHQAALTYAQCAAAFITVADMEWANAKHGQQWRTTLAKYADLVIGKMLVRDVQQAHILKSLEPIWTTKTETASRLRGPIENVLDYASARSYCSGRQMACPNRSTSCTRAAPVLVRSTSVKASTTDLHKARVAGTICST